MQNKHSERQFGHSPHEESVNMRKKLALVIVLSLISVIYARADAAASGHADIAPVWKGFEDLVADAKKTMMADPNAALEKARKAVAIAQIQSASSRQREALATGLWLEGEALTRVNKIPEARTAIDAATKIASKDTKTTKLDG